MEAENPMSETGETQQEKSNLSDNNLPVDPVNAQPPYPRNKDKTNSGVVAQNYSDWTSVASFTVEYQLRAEGSQQEQQVIVHCNEDDQREVWTALADDAIYPWILSRVKESLEQLPKAEKSIVTTPAIEITQVRFLQPLHNISTAVVVDAANSLLKDVLYNNESVALDVKFKVAGFDVTSLIQQAYPYQVHGKFHNLTTGEDISLDSGQMDHLTEGQSSYIVRLPGVTLSPGPYRLNIFATLHHASIPPAIFEIPILQVV